MIRECNMSDETLVKTCPYCHGTGKNDDDRKTCCACYGTGKIHKHDNISVPDDFWEDTKKQFPKYLVKKGRNKNCNISGAVLK